MSKNHLLTEQHIIRLMRDEYKTSLIQVLKEADVFDDEGNLVIGKDLKVRHKESQYEYTIDDILGDPDTGTVQIALRLPDEPRFEPPPGGDEVLIGNNPQEPRVLGEDETADYTCTGGGGCAPTNFPDTASVAQKNSSVPKVESDATPGTETLDEDELVRLEPSRDFVDGIADEIFVIDQEEFEREYEVK